MPRLRGKGLLVAAIPMVLLAVALAGCQRTTAPAPSAAKAPLFLFHKGEKLTYDLGAGRESSDWRVVLRVLNLRDDGTAEIELVTWKPRFIIAVKPDGQIIRVQDTLGKPATLLKKPSDTKTPLPVLATLDLAPMSVAGTYTLFGLQLPARLPARGGRWTGRQKEEFIAGAGPNFKAGIKDVSATYTYEGPRMYKGRDCLVFVGRTRAYGATSPRRFYFDNAKGQLVGCEVQEKRRGAQRARAYPIFALVKVEQPGPRGR